ncbi:hypothetical protein PSTT_04708, partial [Puccinia striiformis]
VANNPTQPVNNSKPSVLQQISELRGEFCTLNSTLATFFARFPDENPSHKPPPHIPQPRPQPQPPHQPTAPQFHDQFTFSHSCPPTNHYPLVSHFPPWLLQRHTFSTPNIGSSRRFGFQVSRPNSVPS